MCMLYSYQCVLNPTLCIYIADMSKNCIYCKFFSVRIENNDKENINKVNKAKITQ